MIAILTGNNSSIKNLKIEAQTTPFWSRNTRHTAGNTLKIHYKKLVTNYAQYQTCTDKENIIIT
jgi:hypothetical protein